MDCVSPVELALIPALMNILPCASTPPQPAPLTTLLEYSATICIGVVSAKVGSQGFS